MGGTLVPLLSLGIPGSPTAALLMGALVIHGLQPGPQLFVDSPEIIYAIYAGLGASIIAMYSLGQIAMPLWMRVVEVPNTILAPVILGLALIGAYTARNLMFDVWLTLGFGGSGLRSEKVSISPTALSARDRAGLHDRVQLSTGTPDGRGQPDDFRGTASIPRPAGGRAGVYVPPPAGQPEKASNNLDLLTGRGSRTGCWRTLSAPGRKIERTRVLHDGRDSLTAGSCRYLTSGNTSSRTRP